MSFWISIILFVLSLALLKIGFGSLNDSNNHQEYGVESESLHKKFSWFFIILGAAMAALAAFLFLG